MSDEKKPGPADSVVIEVQIPAGPRPPKYIDVDDERAAAFAKYIGKGVDVAVSWLPGYKFRLGEVGPPPVETPIQPGSTPPPGTSLVYRVSEYKGAVHPAQVLEFRSPPADAIRSIDDVHDAIDRLNVAMWKALDEGLRQYVGKGVDVVVVHRLVGNEVQQTLIPVRPVGQVPVGGKVEMVAAADGSPVIPGDGAMVYRVSEYKGPVPTAPTFDVGQCTERGPRTYQEDALAADPARGVFAVADGLGAGGDGDLASQTAVAKVMAMAEGRDDWSAERLATEAAQAADTAVRQAQRTCTGRCQTTLAVLVVRGGQAAVAWCGDSRVYRLRAGRLDMLTEPHRISRNVLARCLGSSDVERSESEVRTVDVLPGDVFLLVTDGIGDELAKFYDAASVMWDCSAQRMAEELALRALESGSNDNCTALVVRVGGAS